MKQYLKDTLVVATIMALIAFILFLFIATTPTQPYDYLIDIHQDAVIVTSPYSIDTVHLDSLEEYIIKDNL